MSKFYETLKSWGDRHPKTVRFGKAVNTALLRGVCDSLVGQMNTPAQPVTAGDTEVLTAEQITALGWMSTTQLKSIFAGRKVAFGTDKDSLEALNWLSTAQINAILGKE